MKWANAVSRRWLLAVTVSSTGLLHYAAASAAQSDASADVVRVQNVAENILWTRRADRYTLQIVADWRRKSPSSLVGNELPVVEAWLLKSDGTAVVPFQRWHTLSPKPKAPVPIGARPEVLYAFPVKEAADAVAVVVCIDGDCIARKIEPFRN